MSVNENWIKFDYDDGAEVFYKINPDSQNVDFKAVVNEDEVTNRFSLFFDEIEEVLEKIKSL